MGAVGYVIMNVRMYVCSDYKQKSERARPTYIHTYLHVQGVKLYLIYVNTYVCVGM